MLGSIYAIVSCHQCRDINYKIVTLCFKSLMIRLRFKRPKTPYPHPGIHRIQGLPSIYNKVYLKRGNINSMEGEVHMGRSPVSRSLPPWTFCLLTISYVFVHSFSKRHLLYLGN